MHTKEDILDILAPCGLNCRRCVANTKGPILEASLALQRHLGNFEVYAKRYARFYPVFKNYPAFKEMLEHFIDADCEGCRKGHCKYPSCGVAECEKIVSGEVAFCYECAEFPCDRPEFHEDLSRRWKEKNTRIKEVGVEQFLSETQSRPRYQ